MLGFLRVIYAVTGVLCIIYGILALFQIVNVPPIEVIAGIALIAYGNTIMLDIEKN